MSEIAGESGISKALLFHYFTNKKEFLSYIKKLKWAAKFSLGIINLFIGIGFFAWYGTEPIQKFFAFPLYIICGVLFLYESLHNKDDILKTPTAFQMFLLVLYLAYPFVSILLGNSFPQMVTYIMPCPVISISMTVYAGYKRKNSYYSQPIAAKFKEIKNIFPYEALSSCAA